MDHPSQLFSRIRRQKSRFAMSRPGREPAVAPAPAQSAVTPMSVQPADPRDAPAVQPPAEPSTKMQSGPARSHTLYSQIMRSHDRMGTRHLEAKSPANGP